MADDHRLDQIIGEAFSKSASVILGARQTASPTGERPPPSRRTAPNKTPWFNLNVPELESVAMDVAPWRRGSMQSPLIIQVILEPRRGRGEASGEPVGGPSPQEVLLEEWALDFRPSAPSSSRQNAEGDSMAEQGGKGLPLSRRQAAHQDTHAIYKRLRHPAVPYEITSRIVPGLSMVEDRTTGSFRFAAVETPKGGFQAWVTYRAGNPVPELEELQHSYGASPGNRIISDYIQSPPPLALRGQAGVHPSLPSSAPSAAPSFWRSTSMPSSAGRNRGTPQAPATKEALPSFPREAETGLPDVEMVERSSSSLPPSRHSWASNPVQVAAAPRWSLPPREGGAAQPSLLPKATPWSQGSTAPPKAQAQSPSPRSTLNHPSSCPSSRPVHASPEQPGTEPVKAALRTSFQSCPAAPQQHLVVPDHQSGFHPSAAPWLNVAAGPAQAIKLAQGGIAAAAEAGRMEKQDLSGILSRQQQSQGCKLDTVLPSESGEGDGREKIASTPHSLKQQGERQATETARDENSSDLLGGRPRSSPVRIPGAAATAKMPRNSSSSQLHVHHGERDAGGGCSSRHTGAGAGEPVWDPAVSQRPVLSAPEVHGCHFLAPPTYAKQQTEQGGEKGALGAGQCLAGAATAQDDSESTKAHQAPRRSLKMALTGQQDAQHGELHLDGHAVQGQLQANAVRCAQGYAEIPCSSAAASSAGLSCSPQLPFAFTPSSQSCSLLNNKSGAALMEAHTLGRQEAGKAAGLVSPLGSSPAGVSISCTTLAAPSPGSGPLAPVLMGRDVSDLAIIKRPSWSSRSFSQDGQLLWLGSFSPSSNLMGVSQGSSFAGGPAMQSFPALPGGFSPAALGGDLDAMLQGQGAFCQDHEEDDALPFALEDCIDDGRAAWPDPLAPASGPSAGNGLLASLSSDAAVGALARMLQEAPKLTSGAGPTLDDVLGDIEGLRYQLEHWQGDRTGL